MHAQIVFLAAGALLALHVLIKIFAAITSPERSIPGPFLARFSKLWFLSRVRNGDFHHDTVALHEKYGPIVRVAPGWYTLSKPDKTAYGVTSKFPKGEWYEGWKHPDPDKFTLFADRNIKRHADTKRIFSNMYSLSTMLHYEGYVKECTELLTQKARGWSSSGESVNMTRWFQYYAFDVMADVTYSARFGFLDRGEDIAGLIASLDQNTYYSTQIGLYAWAHKYAFALGQKLGLGGGTGRVYLMKFVADRIAARKAQRQKREKGLIDAEKEADRPTDFLDKILDAQEEDPQKVTPWIVVLLGMGNIVAGSDTTASGLSAMLYYLMTTPRTMSKLREELDAAAKQQEVENDMLLYKETSKLPYLQAVIKEALRIHAVAGLPSWREVPAGGAVVCGQAFSAGSNVGISAWAAHHDKSIYGEDADVFRPERWIEAEEDPEKLKEMESNFVAWGMGARTCIGRHVATMELCNLVPELIRRFDFKLDMSESEWKAKNYLFVKPEKFMVKVSERTRG